MKIYSEKEREQISETKKEGKIKKETNLQWSFEIPMAADSWFAAYN